MVRTMTQARPNINPLLPAFLLAALLAVLAAACAPASDRGGPAGVDAGDLAPPFAMQLADGAQVTLQNLVDGQRPVLMMYFATW